MKLAMLCSGGGGNLRFIQSLIDRGVLTGVQLCGVFADRDCKAAAFAFKRHIPTVCGVYNPGQPESMVAALEKFEPDLIVSLFHQLIAPEIVKRYRGSIINLHYSLIPAFSGKGMIGSKPVRLAIERGCLIIGTTVHYVDDHLDEGEIISQTCIQVDRDEAFTSIMNRVFHSGCLNLLSTIAPGCNTLSLGAEFWENIARGD